jgi:chromosome segregation ATPase
MSRIRRRIVPDRKKEAPAEGPPEQAREDVMDWVDAGARVTAVLESAKEAAEDILVGACREADRFLAEVEDAAKATFTEAARRVQAARREAERLRAEAERYSAETREAADAYASVKRQVAEEAAAKATLEAEEQVRQQAAIVAEATRFEDRLQNLVTIFRGMTDQLEDLLAKGPKPVEEKAPAEETLHESLEEPVKAKRASRAKLPSS